jgi:hypothetical protein
LLRFPFLPSALYAFLQLTLHPFRFSAAFYWYFLTFPAPVEGLFAKSCLCSSLNITGQPLHNGVQARCPRQLGIGWVVNHLLGTCKVRSGGGRCVKKVAELVDFFGGEGGGLLLWWLW